MPSDPRIEMALGALKGPIDDYRSALVTTAEEVRGFLADQRSRSFSSVTSVAAGLGQFAAGRIDVDRFSTLMADSTPHDPATLEKVEKAFDVLRVLAAGGDDLFQVKLKSGSRLRDLVGARLAEIGRAFAAARVAGLASAGSLAAGRENNLLAPLGFEFWTQAERRMAPPLVVQLDGADLRPGELIEFLDGAQKIVLVVNGEMAPAPLVRLITPTTFVLQTAAEQGLDRFSASAGPAVAALVPEGAAQFVHDPAGGAEPWERLKLFHLPAAAPKRPVGGLSPRQQKEELDQLLLLARRPSGEAAPAPAPNGEAAVTATTSDTPVDKLAAWLLTQADLSNLE